VAEPDRRYWRMGVPTLSLASSRAAIGVRPLATLDTDVAVPAQLSVAGPNMHECLIASGFLEEKLGEAQPPTAHYRLVSAETGFYAEFLTPLEGNE
jgi:hypothetical protein